MCTIKWIMEITISLLNVNKFKGLRQDVDYSALSLDYCHTLQNLDVDDPAGRLSVRKGYQHKYDIDALTAIKSAYEYRFDVSSETVVLLNYTGTLKTITDGAAAASLTLPTGATLETSFKNNYMGYKDHILITTGNSSTNYILWYGYVNRVAADNTGIFDNVLEETDYLLLKSQMISVNGTFANVHDVVQVGDYYYFSFIDSKYIEKRDATTFKLIERFEVSQDALEGESVALATDDTYVYALFVYDTSNDGTADGVKARKITPNGWATEATFTETGATHHAGGICTDGTNVFVAINNTSTTPDTLFRLNASMVEQAGDTGANILDICCDTNTTITTGEVFILKVGGLYERQKDDLAVDLSSNTTYAAQIRCFFWDTGTDYVFVTSTTGTGTIYRYPAADITAGVTSNTEVDNPHALIEQNSLMRGISRNFGTVESWSEDGADSTIFPRFISINTRTTQASGLMGVGTYFYKICVEDMDGQIYTLSDPVIQTLDTADYSIWLRLTCHDDDVNYYYRIKNINIFRAYNEVEDAGIPSTDYKFLKAIDINSSGWKDDTTDHELYYYEHLDNISEDLISTTTYLEMSGIDDTVKPRYVNGKYISWVGDQLHMANFNHDDEDFPNRIIRSADNAPDAISFYDYYDFKVGDGDEIKAISTVFGRSVVFKNRRFGVFYNGSFEKEYIPGLASPSGYHKIGDNIFYVSDVGLHVYDGRGVTNIHYPVKTYFDTVTLTDASVFYFDSMDRVIFSFPTERYSLVYNIKYNTWTYYVSFGFVDYFKNYENEYIGWDSSRFRLLFGTSVNDAEDFEGGNGTGIAINYESPLIKLSSVEGDIGIPISHRHRVLKDAAVLTANLITFTWYEYQDDASGKVSVYTQALDSPVGSAAAVKSYFFDPIIGESFSAKLSGTVSGGSFTYHGLTIEYEQAGYWDGR